MDTKINEDAYSRAGVNLDKAASVKATILQHIQRTHTDGVLPALGGFGGLYSLDELGAQNTILVSSADGVGTKLKIAFASDIHSTVGKDLVAHCVNDILTQGASPLFFMDYLAYSSLNEGTTEQIIRGLADECKNNHCALIGGETAQMPGFYTPGEYDLAGFIVGSVKKNKLLGPKRILSGNFLIGLPSTGLHTNGYSLARKVLLEDAGLKLNSPLPDSSCSVGEELLKVHRSYLHPVRSLIDHHCVLAAAHITGGGITENLPRILPPGFCAHIYRGRWPVPAIFSTLQRLGNIEEEEMYRVFNMGIGMILVVPPEKLETAKEILQKAEEAHYLIGEVVRGNTRVIYQQD